MNGAGVLAVAANQDQSGGQFLLLRPVRLSVVQQCSVITDFCCKICDLRPKSPFISETVRDMPVVAVERQSKVIDGGPIRVGFDDLE